MRPSPQHAGTLPASGVTSLQVARSLSGDFLEFVSNAAIEYRFARGYDNRLPQLAAGSQCASLAYILFRRGHLRGRRLFLLIEPVENAARLDHAGVGVDVGLRRVRDHQQIAL